MTAVKKALSVLLLLNLATSTQAVILPYPNTLQKVSANYDTILLKTWEGIKKRNIDAYPVPLVHRPKSELPGDAVSEGVGYGMLLALYCDDQVYFNKIWDAAESKLWQGEFYNWRADPDGSVMGTGAAADAEEDICLALIFADTLAKKGHWQQHTSPKGATYASRAQEMVNSIWKNMVVGGKILDPGSGWSYGTFVNPGYFAPAFYRVFDEFETVHHDWNAVIDQCYASIKASPGYANGLAPDWMTPDGKFVTGQELGYNVYADGKYCYKDAIRCLWRAATDFLWYGDARALAYLTNGFRFVQTVERADFYQTDGQPLPATDTFSLGNKVVRTRREHSHLTLGMWAPVALCSGTLQQADSFSNALLGFYSKGADFWGRAADSSGGEDTLHNEMYFDQFLAWFGAALIGGVFTNLWEDFKDPHPETPLAWKSPPIIDTLIVDANVKPLHLRAVYNKPAAWTLSLAHADSNQVCFSYSGKSDTIDFTWNGTDQEGGPAPTGLYTLTIVSRGMADPFTARIWLGRTLALMSGDGLLVDDFRDGDTKPFIGDRWTSYLDSDEGKAGQSSVTRFKVLTEQTSTRCLTWEYLLKQGNLGFNGYAALEWNAGSYAPEKNYAGLESIVISCRTSRPDSFSVQLITSDITDYNFFEDSLVTGSAWKTFTFPLAQFKRRWNGNGGNPALDKLTAIRFQKQGPDNSANALQVEKMLFKGRLDNVYQNPPPFVAPDTAIRVLHSKQIGNASSWVKFSGKTMFRIFPPEKGMRYIFSVVSLDGCQVLRHAVATHPLIIDCTGYADGVYIASLVSERYRLMQRILISQ